MSSDENKEYDNSTITLTFCDVSENHVGMEKIGKLADKGYSIKELIDFKSKFENAEIIKITCDEEVKDKNGNIVKFEDAYILLIKDGINQICDKDQLFQEMLGLDFDKKAFMRGQVKNKNARWNLCFADIDHSREPNYEAKQGRIIAFNDDKIELMREFKDNLQEIFCEELTCELNMYYDVSKTGIGFHGDSERRKVIGCRMGQEMPLYYQWYYNGERVGKKYKFVLKHGDMYVMSDKAVGFDWKKRVIPTLRHSAGFHKRFVG